MLYFRILNTRFCERPADTSSLGYLALVKVLAIRNYWILKPLHKLAVATSYALNEFVVFIFSSHWFVSIVFDCKVMKKNGSLSYFVNLFSD